VSARLSPLPPPFADTRLALHRLAVYVVSPARRLATGNEIALAATRGGFGTPPGEPWGQVRVEGVELVVERGGRTRRAPLTTLREAAALAEVEPDIAAESRFDVPPAGDLDAPLAVDAASAAVLADWYALADSVLAQFAAGLPAVAEASPPRLWPEHFDLAVDAGEAERGRRGSWGLSPGDALHPEPYAYVSLWSGAPPDDWWGEPHFPGVALAYAELLAAPDPCARALAFLAEARRRLEAAP
jgi:hypothetical protein